MITDAIMVILHGLGQLLANWMEFALPPAPALVADFVTGLATVYDRIPNSVKYFVPLGPAMAAALGYLGLVLVLGVIRFGRRVLSLFTGGGGNA